MKLKPAHKEGKVLVELGPQDEALFKPLPFQVRRILVPMDFSETAKKALQYAVPFASAFNAELMVVHVMQPFSLPAELGYIPPEAAETQEELKQTAEEELGKLCAQEIGVRSQFQVQVREGVAWQEVVLAAGDCEADLIILATHGRTGLQHVLLGSVAERVVRHAPCPVLVVRERERDFIATPGQTGAPSA